MLYETASICLKFGKYCIIYNMYPTASANHINSYQSIFAVLIYIEYLNKHGFNLNKYLYWNLIGLIRIFELLIKWHHAWGQSFECKSKYVFVYVNLSTCVRKFALYLFTVYISFEQQDDFCAFGRFVVTR